MTDATTDRSPAALTGACSCGKNTFRITIRPTERFVCHCLFCQQFVGRSYTDVLMIAAADVDLDDAHATYRNPHVLPPGFAEARGYTPRIGSPDRGRFARCANLDRASCDDCGDPFAEKVGPMVFVPAWTVTEQDRLPPVQRHLYDRFHTDAPADHAGRSRGHLSSQAAVIAMTLRAVRGSRAARSAA